jgi:hypothetical protein
MEPSACFVHGELFEQVASARRHCRRRNRRTVRVVCSSRLQEQGKNADAKTRTSDKEVVAIDPTMI